MTNKYFQTLIVAIIVFAGWSLPAHAANLSDSQARILYQQLQKAESELMQARGELQAVRAESARRDAELANLNAVRKNNEQILSKLKESLREPKSILENIPRWLGR